MTLELTKAEIDLITLKREQEELIRKEDELKRKTKIQTGIIEMEKQIAKKLQKDRDRVDMANKYCKELGEGWVLDLQSFMVKEIYKDGVTDTIHWSKEVEYTSPVIRKGEYMVGVNEHTSYTRYNMYTTYGYKMYISGPGFGYKESQRSYVKATTVNDLIKKAIDSENQKKIELENKVNALKSTLERLQNEFPGAKVVANKEYSKFGGAIDVVYVTFPNNITIRLQVFSDGSTSRLGVDFPTKNADNWELMKTLSEVKFEAKELA